MKRHVASQRRRGLALAALVVLVVAGSAAPAAARPGSGPTVQLGSAAGLAPDGGSITVSLVASCPERWTVVEALVTVSQRQASGEASFPLTCTGATTPFSVTVPSSGGTFELGEAQAAASVVIKRGRTDQAVDSQVVQVDPTVFVQIADVARLQSGGGAVSIDVTTACPVGSTGQQSYVNVSQGQQAFGNGTFVPTCDGLRHTSTVLVQASQGLYQAGSARALSFAFVEEGGDSFSGIDDRPIELVT